MPKKPLSTILEAIEEEDEEIIEVATPTAEEEIPEEEILKRKKIIMVVCPFCGLHRVVEKKGTRLIEKAKKKQMRVYEPEIKSGEYILSERSKFYNPHKITAFNLYNFKDEPFLSIRIAIPRCGFVEVGVVKLQDIPFLPEKYRKMAIEFVKQILKQAEEFKNYVKSLKILGEEPPKKN